MRNESMILEWKVEEDIEREMESQEVAEYNFLVIKE